MVLSPRSLSIAGFKGTIMHDPLLPSVLIDPRHRLELKEKKKFMKRSSNPPILRIKLSFFPSLRSCVSLTSLHQPYSPPARLLCPLQGALCCRGNPVLITLSTPGEHCLPEQASTASPARKQWGEEGKELPGRRGLKAFSAWVWWAGRVLLSTAGVKTGWLH